MHFDIYYLNIFYIINHLLIHLLIINSSREYGQLRSTGYDILIAYQFQLILWSNIDFSKLLA